VAVSRLSRSASLGVLLVATVPLWGCNGGGDTAVAAAVPEDTSEAGIWWKLRKASPSPSTSPTATSTPSPTPSVTATPTPTASSVADFLLYWGPGATESAAQALADIVTSHGLTYRRVDASGLNAMTSAELASYSTILWPGGDSNVADAALSPDTKIRVRQAVINSGVGFSGFCAGAWIAVGPNPGTAAPAWGFAILAGNYLKEYLPNGQYLTNAMVPITYADGSVRSEVWWQGPYLWSNVGTVVAKYPTGEAATIESWAGKGYVTLTGVHPEAPQSWRDGLNDTDGLDTAFAWSMIDAARRKSPLRTF